MSDLRKSMALLWADRFEVIGNLVAAGLVLTGIAMLTLGA